MCQHDCLNYMKYNCVGAIGIGYMNWNHCIQVHGDIALSRVWVHVWLFTTLGECGLSLTLGLCPIKTHSSNHKMKSN